MELNPNHPLMETMRNQYYKLLVVVLQKFELPPVEITSEDLDMLGDSALVIRDKGGSLVLEVVDKREAREIAKRAGGCVQ